MKIGRYLAPRTTEPDGSPRTEGLGIVVHHAGILQVMDLAAIARVRGTSPMPRTMDGFMEGGPEVLDAAYRLRDWALERAEAAWFREERSVEWLAPVQVRTCFAAGRNFGRHKAETAVHWKAQGAQFHNEIPMGFIKLARTIVPTRSEVARPPESNWFDYEVEPAAIIGRHGLRVAESDALKLVFGYTVFNDLSARDIQRREMANQSILAGKNLPGFGPLGPWILTADEVPDPAQLELKLRVNGRERQNSLCTDMLNSFAQLISSWSSMGLAPSDVIAGGTPAGVAIGRPNPQEFFLKPGDRVEAEITQIGVLETFIV